MNGQHEIWENIDSTHPNKWAKVEGNAYEIQKKTTRWNGVGHFMFIGISGEMNEQNEIWENIDSTHQNK